MFDVNRVSVQIGEGEISFETGKLARQASGSVVVRSGDTMVLCDRDGRQPPRRRLPPADGGCRGAPLRRGQDPRLVLPARGPRRREGNFDGAHDRPADPPAVPEGLALRDAAGLPDDVGGPRPPLRHPRDERRLRRDRGVGHPAAEARRRRPHRQARRRLRRQPGRGGLRRPGDGPGRLRHRRGHPDGRVRRRLRERGRGPRRARHRPRRDQEDRRGVRGARAEGGQGEARGRGPADRRGAARLDQGVARREARRGRAGRGEARPPGRDQRRRGGGPRHLRRD